MATAAIDITRPMTRKAERSVSLVQILPAAFFIYATLLPPEVAFYAGSFRMGAYRIALFLLVPWVITQLATGKIKFGFIDFMMLVTALWLPVSFAQNYDVSVGIEAGGSQTVDMMLAYLVGRCSLNNFESLRRLLIIISPGLLVAGLLLVGESIIGSLFVRQTAQSIFGAAGEVGSNLNFEKRLGLVRAYGTFSHPIHAGVFMSTFLPIFFMLFRNKIRKFSGFGFGVLGFFSLSSAGFLAMLLNIAFLGYDWLQKTVRDIGWRLALVSIATMACLIQMFSEGGVISVIYRYLTFNPGTGWYRTQIWKYASDDVLANPWFGIGYEPYTRPHWFWGSNSIDAHYLSMAVKYGLVPALLYFLIAIAIVVLLARAARQSALSTHRDVFVGLTIALSTIIIVMFTVAFWGAMLAWFNFMLGLSLSLARNRRNTMRPIRR